MRQVLHDGDLICEGVVHALKSAPQAATPAASASTEAAAAPTGDAGVPLGVAAAPAGEASELQEATAGQVCTGYPGLGTSAGPLRNRLCRSCCQMRSQGGAKALGLLTNGCDVWAQRQVNTACVGSAGGTRTCKRMEG